MFNPLACLSFRLQRHEEEEEEEEEEEAAANYPSPPSTTPSTPRSWSSSSSKNGTNIFCINGRNKKNPFSKLGLDKFSSLLMDLEERRRKIYEQMPSHSHRVPYIRFIYSNTGDWVPIVVQLRDLNNHKHRHNKQKHNKAAMAKAMGSKAVGSRGGQHKPQLVSDKAQPPADTNKYPTSSRSRSPTTTTTTTTAHGINSSKASSTLKPMVQFRQPPPASSSSAGVTKAANNKNIQIISRRHSTQHISQSHSKYRSLERWRLPSQYLPIVVVLSLVCLVIFGRSVAILLTAVWWYLIPTIKTPPTPIVPKPKRSSFVNKEYTRKSSDNNISHP